MKTHFLLAIGFLLLYSAGASAHHSHASLDPNNVQQQTGVVTKYSWRMPHVFIKLDGPNAQGEVVEWTIELLHPAGMAALGWDENSLKPGERIIWEGKMDVDPNRYYSGLVWAEKADGTRLDNSRSNTGQPTLVAPSADFTGMWVRDQRVGFTYYPLDDWPYTALAQKKVDAFSETQNPQFNCEDPGPPKSTQLPYPILISRPDSNSVVLDYDMRDQQRVLHMDRDIVTGPPSKIGQSKAWMEGDELVVETSNFVADVWGSYTGVDSSDQKHLIERFSLIEDGNTLRIQMTLTDPMFLTRPVEIDYFMRKIHTRELFPGSCSLEAARLFIEAGYQ